jgi:hypothetical protein
LHLSSLGRIVDLLPIASLEYLEYLVLDNLKGVRSVAPLVELSGLSKLYLNRLPTLVDLHLLRESKSLQELHLGPSFKEVKIPSEVWKWKKVVFDWETRDTIRRIQFIPKDS